MPHNRLIVLLPILALLILAPAGPARGNGLHTVHWNRYATEHFDILFHDAVRPQANLARQFLEPAYAKITRDLGMRERGVRISVVLSGRPDESNGSATPLGHVIMIYTRPAQVMAAGDIAWLKRVLAHELAHQITFLSLRKGFLGIWSEIYKASHLPAWFMEGLAQYESETWDAKRNTFFAHALYNSALEPYPDLAVYTKMSPVSGRLIYEQGHAFVRYLADREGPDFWARVLKRIRVIPVWSEVKALLSPITAGMLPLEGAIRAESGQRVKRMYRDFTDSLRSGLPRHPAAASAWNGGIKGFAIVWQIRRAPDGALWFTGQRNWETSATGLYTLRSGKVETRVGSGVDPVFDLSPDGKRVLYVRSYTDRHRDPVEKLFLLQGGISRFISDGASHPIFWSADSVAFSHYREGRQALAFCAPAGGCRETSPDTLDGFYALSPSRNGLLLNASDAAGRAGIYEYAREGGFALLFHDTVTAEFPLESADGSVWMLHDRNGLLQVDGLDRATGTVFPVATFPLGTFFPQRIAPGVIASVAQTGKARDWRMQPVEIRAPVALTSGSSARAVDTSARVVDTSARAADTSARAADTSARAADTSARTVDTSAQAVDSSTTVSLPSDSLATFAAPGFLASARPEFPLDSGIAFDSGSYYSIPAMRPLLAGPASFPTFGGGALGAFILLADPVGFNSLSASMAPNMNESPVYEAEYVNNESAVQVTLFASNADYALRKWNPPPSWNRMSLERRTSVYSARFDFPMPAPLPLGHYIWAGLKAQVSIWDWRLAGSQDSTRILKIVKGAEWQQAKFNLQAYLAYTYFRPNAYGLVHPLLRTDLEGGTGIGGSDLDQLVFWYARQTFPIWSELTFTALYEGNWRHEALVLHWGMAGEDTVAFFSGVRGYNQSVYAGLDFPIHKGYLGEWPLLGLWNYVGAGFFFGYGREAYEKNPYDPDSGFLEETGAVGTKVDMLFHIMRRVPLVLSTKVQWDYLLDAGEFRIGAEVGGIPRSFSLFGARQARWGSAGRNGLRAPVKPR